MKYGNVVDNYIQLNLKIKSSSLYVSNIVCNNFTEKKNTQTVFINLKQILNPYIQKKTYTKTTVLLVKPFDFL